jgi:sterol desaturase/sphingolipid hydroxylase (fatty acid hydroxylase superfamily)
MSMIEYYEQYVQAGVYYSLFALMPLLEMILPLRTNKHPLLIRWTSNFLLGIVNGLSLRFLFPILGLAFAIYVQQRGWGLFNLFEVPNVIAIILCLLIIDFSKYVLHWIYHYVPLFWAFHKIHHTDPDYDFTTSFRFHPLESIIGAANTLIIILLLGMPVIAVIIYEVLVITINFFVHTNIKLPVLFERLMRGMFITPDMHRIHHSAYEPHTNSNYGIVFPFWDYLAKTYTPVGSVDQENMVVGLLDCQGKKHLNIFWLLILPFVPKKQETTKT